MYFNIIGNVFEPKDVRKPSATVSGYVDGISSFLINDCWASLAKSGSAPIIAVLGEIELIAFARSECSRWVRSSLPW